MTERYTSEGLLLIDGKVVGPCAFQGDVRGELLGTPLRVGQASHGQFEMDVRGWADFCKQAGVAQWDGPIPEMDLTVWVAIDPNKPMPCVAVDEGTEVITKCARGGGSVGRVWRGARITGVCGHEQA